MQCHATLLSLLVLIGISASPDHKERPRDSQRPLPTIIKAVDSTVVLSTFLLAFFSLKPKAFI